MEAAQKACSAKQAEYQACMRTWFNEKFLKGQLIPNSECQLTFEALRDCVSLHFQKV